VRVVSRAEVEDTSRADIGLPAGDALARQVDVGRCSPRPVPVSTRQGPALGWSTQTLARWYRRGFRRRQDKHADGWICTPRARLQTYPATVRAILGNDTEQGDDGPLCRRAGVAVVHEGVSSSSARLRSRRGQNAPLTKITDTFGFLLGTWRVERWIEDLVVPASGSFRGTASVLERPPDGDASPLGRARYDETGELHFGSYRGSAQRRLEYHRMGAAVLLHFSDGRPFVDLDLRAGEWRSRHLCGADRYEMAFLVLSRDVVEERWQVQGPTKGYEAVTTLTRLG
jgi:hypothetical protein